MSIEGREVVVCSVVWMTHVPGSRIYVTDFAQATHKTTTTTTRTGKAMRTRHYH